VPDALISENAYRSPPAMVRHRLMRLRASVRGNGEQREHRCNPSPLPHDAPESSPGPE
jgi:hypothetical protein